LLLSTTRQAIAKHLALLAEAWLIREATMKGKPQNPALPPADGTDVL